MSVDNLVGQALGQYELKELLGAGGMGAVYRAFQSNLKREVAVKVLPSGLASQAGYIERFNREAEIAASLEHPNIVPIYDYGTQNSISYVVMRLLGGGSLAQRLGAHEDGSAVKPSVGETVHFLRQLASALDYAHSHNVVHRDIKPGNVTFDNHGTAYLVDFGIAKLMDGSSNLTGTGMMVGTPSYMAPELWRGDQASPASDQYALAAMIYGMMSGRLPFEAPTPYSLMHKHMNEMPTPLQTLRSDVPPSLTTVLERALAKEPRARFPTATAFAQAFENAAEGARGQPTGIFTAPVAHVAPRARVITPRSTPALGASTYTPQTFMQRPTAPITPIPAPRRQSPLLWVLIVVIVALIATLIVLLINPFGGSAPTATSNAVLASATSAATTAALVPSSEPPTALLPPTVDSVIVPVLPSNAPTETPALEETNQAATQTALIIAPTETPALLETVVAATQNALIVIGSSATPEPSDTPAPSDTPTVVDQPLIVLVMSPSPTVADTATPVPSDTPVPSQTPLPTETEGAIVLIVPPTDTPAPSDTPFPTVTETPPPTETPAPTDTPIPSATPLPTDTPVPSATSLPTQTSTEPPTVTIPPTATEPPTATVPATIAVTPTVIPDSPLLVPAGSPITVYSGPDATGDTLGQISDNEPLLVVGANHNFEYFLIQFGPQLGWVVAKGAFGYTGNVGAVPVVADQAPFVDGGKISVPIYVEPNLSAAPLGTATNQLLLITGLSEQKDFFRVDFFGASGWVPVNGASAGGNLSTIPIVPFGAPELVVGAQGIAVHSAPVDLPDNIIATEVSTTLPITGITTDRQFWRVDSNGQEGWVKVRVPGSDARGDLSTVTLIQSSTNATPLLTATPAVAPTVTLIAINVSTPVSTATPAGTGVTVSNFTNVNIRGGDGLNYPVVDRLVVGTVADVLGVSSRGSGWYQVRLPNGTVGWVGYNVVQVHGDPSNLPRVDPPSSSSASSSSGGGSGSGTSNQPAQNSSGVDCRKFRGTSPLSVVHIGGEPFFWDPAPGATSYRIIASNESGKVRMILEATSTSVSADTSKWAGDHSITWMVQALKNGQVVCTTPAISIPTTG